MEFWIQVPCNRLKVFLTLILSPSRTLPEAKSHLWNKKIISVFPVSRLHTWGIASGIILVHVLHTAYGSSSKSDSNCDQLPFDHVHLWRHGFIDSERALHHCHWDLFPVQYRLHHFGHGRIHICAQVQFFWKETNGKINAFFALHDVFTESIMTSRLVSKYTGISFIHCLMVGGRRASPET